MSKRQELLTDLILRIREIHVTADNAPNWEAVISALLDIMELLKLEDEE